MTDSITKSFNNLNIAASPLPPMHLTIPKRETRGRLMFYGFETTEGWLIDYAITHRDTYGLPVSDSGLFNLNYALYILQRQTGIYQLKFKVVLPQGVPVPPKGKQILSPEEHGLVIVAVCSNDKESFQRRASQAQVDHLKGILGGAEPMWWINNSALDI